MQTSSCSSSHGTKTSGVLFGLLLVIAGLLFLSFNFGWVDPSLKTVLFSWPIPFIVFAIIGLSRGNYLVTLFWLILGGFFLLPRIAAVYPDLIPGVEGDFGHTYWPLLLILFGIGFILKVVSGRYRRGKRTLPPAAGGTATVSGERGYIKKEVIFGGSESVFLDPLFRGGEISAIFGGVVLDLRKTQLPEGTTYIDVVAVFGGLELHLPDDWLVETKFQTVLGGFQDKRLVSLADQSRKLVIQGDLIFGGCEVR